MQIPNITLAYLVAELAPLLEGSIVRKVQELPNEWLKLKLQTKQGTKDLIIAPSTFFVTSYSLQAKQQSSGFGAFLRSRLANKKIISLKQHTLDRIALLEFDEYFLILELFAKGNAILTTKEMEIVSAYRKEQWKDRTISKGQPYKFPSSKGLNPLEVSLAELKKAFSENKADCIRTLVSALNVAPIVGEEACLKAGIEKTKEAAKVGGQELEKILGELKKLYIVDLKKIKPGIAAGQLLPFELSSAGKFEKPFPSLNEALNEHFAQDFSSQKGVGKETAKKAQLERGLERQLAAIKELENKVVGSREKGEAIYSNYTQVKLALELAKQFAEGKIGEKDVMYKLNSLGVKLKQIDLKNKRVIIEIKG